MTMPDAYKSLHMLLDETPWLQMLPAIARERVLRDASEISLEQGCSVVTYGQIASYWIGVAEGLLKVSLIHRTGKVVMFTGAPEGSWIGEGAVIKREHYRYDISTMRKSRIILIPCETLHWLLDNCQEFNRLMILRLNERLGQFVGMMEIARLDDPVSRVARSLAVLYNPILYPSRNSILTLSQTELGELTGMTRQSVSKSLKSLEAQGLISMEYGAVKVIALQDLINYQECD